MPSRWHLADSLSVLLREVDTRWPNRSKKSDGTIGDAQHAARRSDHNPNKRGSVNALDITYPGVDPKLIIEAVKKHPSAAYVIFDKKIYMRIYGWKAQPYSGKSPHKDHLHISIMQSKSAEEDKTSWLYKEKKKLPKYPGTSRFRVGSRGEAIRVIQTAFGNKVNGIMSVGDLNDVKAFQRKRPWLWPADGIVGPRTYDVLSRSAAVKRNYL
jgi:hypothetical protein